jgi:hypothetical protein
MFLGGGWSWLFRGYGDVVSRVMREMSVGCWLSPLLALG